jgi:uncharacterized protein
LLVLGGDLMGKQLVLVRKRANGRFDVRTAAGMRSLEGEAERQSFEQQCADRGLYVALVDADTDIPEADREQLLVRMARERLARWLEHARAKLPASVRPILAIPGNDDPAELDSAFFDDDTIVNLHERIVERDNFQFAGLGWSTPTPWHTHREFPDERIGEALTRTLAGAHSEPPLILNVHVPPYGSGLDTCVRLDAELRPVIGPGGPLTEPVGSKAVAQFIRERQPLLGLFGHVHEARGCTSLGQTLCANPGSDFSNGKLFGFLAVLRGAKVENWMLTEG